VEKMIFGDPAEDLMIFSEILNVYIRYNLLNFLEVHHHRRFASMGTLDYTSLRRITPDVVYAAPVEQCMHMGVLQLAVHA
jgi:hypothetical protein